jgi:hypothetical protein
VKCYIILSFLSYSNKVSRQLYNLLAGNRKPTKINCRPVTIVIGCELDDRGAFNRRSDGIIVASLLHPQRLLDYATLLSNGDGRTFL